MGQKYVYNPLTCEYDIINEGAPGVPGPRGPVGGSGPAGQPGQGVAPGGATGQVLAKASGEDFETEWVDQSGGGGAAATLDQVLAAGNESATSVRLIDQDSHTELAPALLALLDNTTMSTATLDGQGRLTLGAHQTHWMGLDADAQKMTFEHPEIGTFLLGIESSGAFQESSLLLPKTSSPAGAETLATREWVAENGGGGGGGAVPTLQQVLATGAIDSTGVQMGLETNNGQTATRLSSDLIQLVKDADYTALSLTSTEVQLHSGYGAALGLHLGDPNQGILPSIKFGSNSSELVLKRSDDDWSGGEILLPAGAPSAQTLATQEWVNANGGGGGGGSSTPASGTSGERPYDGPVGTFYYDTTLAKPIWWDGAGYVDATGEAV